MKILFVVPYTPNLVRVRPYQWIRSLVANGHEVILATLFSSPNEEQDIQNLKKICKQVVAFKVPFLRSVINCALALPTLKPLQYVYSWDPRLARELNQIVSRSNEQVDVIHIEHLRGSAYGISLMDFMQRRKWTIPIVWDSVDSITHLFRQSAARSRQRTKRWLTTFELGRTEKLEPYLVDKFDHILVTSSEDRDVFLKLMEDKEHASNKKITVLPNGVDLEYFTFSEDVIREPATLVVSGKMSYHANVSMTLFLVDQIMPLVWKHRPDVKLWVVGKDPDRVLKSLAKNPLITVTGTVPDLRQYLQRATVAVAPIVYGAGIQNKVLEAMACGTPVVTGPLALRAIDAQPGVDLEEARNPDEYAEKILHLLENEVYRKNMGRAGRSYVESKHNWLFLSKQLISIYQQINH